jgi:hypothetical protein
MFACFPRVCRWLAFKHVECASLLAKILAGLCLLFSLSGCSSLQIAYNYAPNYLSYRLNGYLNLDEAQRAALDQEFAQFMQWHTEVVLPDYTSALETWRARVDQPTAFTAGEVLEIQEQVEQALEVLGQRAAHQLAGIMVTLTAKQRQHLREKFQSENKEYFEEYLKNPTSDATRRERHKRALKRYEDWLGSLTASQQLLLMDWSDKRSKIFLAWGDERVLRQEALLSLLAQQQGRDSLQAANDLNAYLVSLKIYREPLLASQQMQLRQEWAEVTAEILNSLTSEQKRYLKNKLGEYAQDFVSLTTKRLAKNTDR